MYQQFAASICAAITEAGSCDLSRGACVCWCCVCVGVWVCGCVGVWVCGCVGGMVEEEEEVVNESEEDTCVVCVVCNYVGEEQHTRL